jgi:hypothetical protein
MTYYAKINNGVVETVIVADADFVATQPGQWVQTFDDAPAVRFAGIGDGWNGAEFVPAPFDGAVWTGAEWAASTEMQLEAALLLIDMLTEVP